MLGIAINFPWCILIVSWYIKMRNSIELFISNESNERKAHEEQECIQHARVICAGLIIFSWSSQAHPFPQQL